MIWKTSGLKHTGINLIIVWKRCTSSCSVTQTHRLHLLCCLPNQGVVSAPDSVRQDNLAEGFITIIVLPGNTEPHHCLQVLMPPRSGLAWEKVSQMTSRHTNRQQFQCCTAWAQRFREGSEKPTAHPLRGRHSLPLREEKNKLVFRWTLL